MTGFTIGRPAGLTRGILLETLEAARQFNFPIDRIIFETVEGEQVNDGKWLASGLLLNGWQVADINSRYQLDELKSIRLLAALDRLKLIELQQQNNIRLLVARDLQWLPNGPVRHPPPAAA